AFDGPAPLFAFDGNAPGVGKGLLADVIFLIVLGHRAATSSYTNAKVELQKIITTAAAEGDSMILFDNVSEPLGNSVIDQALTSTRWKDRLLGFNKSYDGPLNVTWYATINNMELSADSPRRILPIRLETDLERSEEREDLKHPDLRAYVLENRSRLLSAALTILKGYCQAGKPQKTPQTPWGSYEPWSGLVRGAVQWVL